MIKLMQGDLLKQDDVDAIVNTVNCVGVMGKGIALQFKNKWPTNFTEYTTACKEGRGRSERPQAGRKGSWQRVWGAGHPPCGGKIGHFRVFPAARTTGYSSKCPF